MLQCTLITDGSSDTNLRGALDWCFAQHGVSASIVWANPTIMRCPHHNLNSKIRRAVDFYPADLYFVHRDAETATFDERAAEIDNALQDLDEEFPHVKVVPIRMTEAWLLHDEAAIRRAAGNPNGRVDLGIPPIRELEGVPNPKQTLENALLIATELSQRRKNKKKKELPAMKRRTSELIRDFSDISELTAFARLSTQIQTALG